jgi:hypothetical protein
MSWARLTTAISLVAGVLMVACAPITQAAYRQPCRAKYETSLGWSQYYDVECIYVSGNELLMATGDLRFDMLKTYVVIFWAQNQASVIKIEELTSCGMEATEGCATLLGNVHGPDQEGRRWELCQEGFCF